MAEMRPSVARGNSLPAYSAASDEKREVPEAAAPTAYSYPPVVQSASNTVLIRKAPNWLGFLFVLSCHLFSSESDSNYSFGLLGLLGSTLLLIACIRPNVDLIAVESVMSDEAVCKQDTAFMPQSTG